MMVNGEWQPKKCTCCVYCGRTLEGLCSRHIYMHVNSSQLTQQLILMAAACLPQRKVASTWMYNSLTLTLTLYYTILQYGLHWVCTYTGVCQAYVYYRVTWCPVLRDKNCHFASSLRLLSPSIIFLCYLLQTDKRRLLQTASPGGGEARRWI